MESPITNTRRCRKSRTRATALATPAPNRLHRPFRGEIVVLDSRAKVLDIPNETQGMSRRGLHEVGRAKRLVGRRLGPYVDQDGPAAGAIPGFDVVEDVANEPGAGKVELEVVC